MVQQRKFIETESRLEFASSLGEGTIGSNVYWVAFWKMQKFWRLTAMAAAQWYEWS